MKSYAVSIATLVAILVAVEPLAAQEIQPGLRVRSWVTPPGEWRTGKLIRFGGDSLVIQRCPECPIEAQPWPSVTRVEVSEGKSWSGRHMLIGALAVGGVAAWIEKRSVDRDMAGCKDGPCGLAVFAIPVVGVLGAGVGAVLGAMWRAESWREIYGDGTAAAPQ